MTVAIRLVSSGVQVGLGKLKAPPIKQPANLATCRTVQTCH